MSWHFPDQERGKGQVMMAAHTEVEVEGDEAQQPEGESDLHRMAQHV